MHPVYIYAPNSTSAQLLTNGLGRLDVISCPVTETINGAYAVSLEVMPEGVNADKVVKYAIIKCWCPKEGGNKYQYFRLDKVSPIRLGEPVTASGWHISYDLASDIILNRAWDAKNGSEALSGILAAGISETRFTGSSNITNITNMHAVRSSILAAILNTDQPNCFLNRWGGEIFRDNFIFNVNSSVGADNGVYIRYAKNLTGLTVEEGASEVATRIIPSCLSADDAVILLPEVYIDSPRIFEYPLPRVKTVHFSDIKIGQEVDGAVPYPDTTDAYQEMWARVEALYNAGADLPKLTISVNFIDLAQTEEFKDFAVLETVNLGDTVHVDYKGTIFSERVVSYEWDPLAEMYNSITLGSIAPNIGESLYASDVDLSALKTSMNTTLKQTDKYYGCGINHADGFVCTADDGHFSKFNADVMGFFDSNGVQIGGMAYVNAVLASIASILTNDATDPEFWATIGQVVEGAVTKQGILGFAKSYSTTNSIYSITAGSMDAGQYFSIKFGKTEIYCETYPADHTNDFIWFYINGHRRLSITGAGGLFVYDQNDIVRLNLNSLGNCAIKDGAGKSIFESSASLTAIRLSGSVDNAIKLTNSGAFNLVINGVDHPISYT